MRNPFTYFTCLLAASTLAMAGLRTSVDFDQTQGMARVQGAAELELRALGTIDTYMGAPSKAVGALFRGEDGVLEIGPLASVGDAERDLACLTVSFDVYSTLVRPIAVTLASADEQGQVTGELTAEVVPPVGSAWYRFGIDLSRARQTSGAFDPAAPKLILRFRYAAGVNPSTHTLRIDNVSYTSPSIFVSGTGSDTSTGRSREHAFATLQHAMNAAQPGDVIMVMNGTYQGTGKAEIGHVPREVVNAPVWRPWWVEQTGGIVRVAKTGKPAAWIVLRAHPGHQPLLYNRGGWEAVKVDLGASYFEMRGLTIQGNRKELNLAEAQADADITERNGFRYYGDSKFNGNGVMVDGRATPDASKRAHHLRFIDNTIFDCAAAGIAAIGTDYVTIEGNTIYQNVNFTRWGASGISFLRASNFDLSPNHRMFIVGNKSYLNRCYVPWVRYHSDAAGNPLPNHTAPRSGLSDGNGIIVDVNRRRPTARPPEGLAEYDYLGRTLVSNNLSYGNGGGGIVMTTVSGVDIVHNTVFDNVQTPELVEKGWGDIMLGGPTPGSEDIVVMNNIIYSRNAPKTIMVNSATQRARLQIAQNIAFGAPADYGTIPQHALPSVDPKFVRPSLDPAEADFRLAEDSPARGVAITSPGHLQPAIDLTGFPRPTDQAPDLGALQFRK